MAENQPHNLHGRAYKNIVPAMRHALSSGLRAAIYSIPRSKSLRWICGDEPRLSIRRLVAVDFARPYSSGIAIYDGLRRYEPQAQQRRPRLYAPTAPMKHSTWPTLRA